ncbi:FG-GAP repeat domain-containing protein [Streptomyces glaucescens]|uniref:FG-GAP repeat domain-containing protein n=1 Tax=Streptomyces glaucescens TaxID=1907 RepID=UPI00117BFB22|nr:VCBS repeat-containing protein [Streptomyces glaucescens]
MRTNGTASPRDAGPVRPFARRASARGGKGDRDFTGDLDDDLLGVSASDDELRMHAGDGDGEFASHEVGGGWGGKDRGTLADIDSDGRAHVVAATAFTGDLHFYAGQSDSLKAGVRVGQGWGGTSHLVRPAPPPRRARASPGRPGSRRIG